MLLDQILLHVPCPIFWKNLEGEFLGCNKLFLAVAGFSDYNELIGKKDSALPWREYKDEYAKDDKYVITTGKMITRIESIPLYDRIIISETTKSPLMQDGQIIGVLGICLDITDRKEVERLKIENEAHRTQLKEQEKFQKICNQVAHDIRSPLSSLLMIVKSCNEIPEEYRIALRDAAISIGDIANSLLMRYQNREQKISPQKESEKTSDILVSTVLLETLTEKKFQYQNLMIKFDYDFNQEGYFAFITIQLSAFRRMLSNIINNAIDSFENKPGKVNIKLQADKKWVKIIVEDNGKGMLNETKEKILKNIPISIGKAHGHGIGLTQVQETLKLYQGKMDIQSQTKPDPHHGTQIILTFPHIKTPNWIAEEIRLTPEDIVIILDDDTSIHGAWNTRFNPILSKNPKLTLHHFEHAGDTIKFIEKIPEKDRVKIFLLTDFELLKQELTGLHVVERSKVHRSILVTSHYGHKDILLKAAKTNTKILPKQLTSEVPIFIDELSSNSIKHRLVDLILVDDNKQFVEILKTCIFDELTVEDYQDPHHFLKCVHNYDKDTKIYLDNNFEHAEIKGIEIAKILHDLGYVRLYLLTGESMHQKQVPSYLTVLLKSDLESIEKSVK